MWPAKSAHLSITEMVNWDLIYQLLQELHSTHPVTNPLQKTLRNNNYVFDVVLSQHCSASIVRSEITLAEFVQNNPSLIDCETVFNRVSLA